MMPLIQGRSEIFSKTVESLSVKDIISKGSQISLLKAADSPFVELVLRLLVQDIITHYNASERVSEDYSKRIVNNLIEKFWWIRVEEIAYVFNRAKNGAYGKVYGVPSEHTFFEWFREYELNDRENEILSINRKLQAGSTFNEKLDNKMLEALYKNKGIDNTPSAPDGSERAEDRDKKLTKAKMSNEEFQKEKMRILNEMKK